MNTELKKIVDVVKKAQVQVKAILQDTSWMTDVRKYAAQQSQEAKKLFAADAKKVRTFLEREVKELEKIQKQIPGEIKKLRQELNQLVGGLKKAGAKSSKKAPAKKAGTRTAAKKKTAAPRKKASAQPSA